MSKAPPKSAKLGEDVSLAKAMGQLTKRQSPWSHEKKHDVRKAFEWVGAHMAYRDLKPSDAPNPLAWGIYKWAQSSRVAWGEFWKTYLSRLLPTKASIDAEARFADDGRDVMRTIELLTDFRSGGKN